MITGRKSPSGDLGVDPIHIFMDKKVTSKPTPKPQQEEIDLMELFFKYFAYRNWIIGSVILFSIVGYLFLKTRPAQYSVDASILVIDQKQNGGAMDALSMLSDLGISSTSSVVEDQVALISSQPIALAVVNRLGLHTAYYKKEFLARKVDLYTGSPVRVQLNEGALNRMASDLSMTLTPVNSGFELTGEYDGETFSTEIARLPATVKTPAGNVEVSSVRGGEFDYPLYITVRNPLAVTDDLVESLDASTSSTMTKKNNIISLSLKTGNKKKGADILNTLISEYNKDAMAQINLSAVNTANFIDGRLKLLSTDLGSVEKEVENFKQTNKLTDISSEAKLFLESNSLYEQKRAEVESQINLVDYVEEYIKSPTGANALIPNLGITDQGLVSVITDYNELILKRERIVRASSPENPLLKDLAAQISFARQEIVRSVQSAKKGLLITRNDVLKQDALTSSRIRQVPRQERQFIEIKRQQKIKEDLYVFLLQKREEAALTMAVTVPKARVLKPADKALQIAPKGGVILMAFFILGLILPIVIVYLKDLLNTTFDNRMDVEKLTTVPVLSELGHNTTGSTILNHASQSDSNAELFRLLRAKLPLALDYPKDKVILITSTVPGEGKTYASINLAISLSLTDKKVLLVGLDLRKPQLANLLELDKKIGVTSYLSGLESDYTQLIFTKPEYPNLDVLPAGAIPPNPSELIQRERLDKLVADARVKYDYIILDTAPVGAVSDTLMLNRLTDLNIYVCRAGYSHKQNLNMVNRIQEEESLTPQYLLVNDVDHEGGHYYGGYYRGYYRYGYGYGYGYGHAKDREDAKRKKNSGVEGLKKKLMDIGKN